MTNTACSASAYLRGDTREILALSGDDHDQACQFEHHRRGPHCDIPLHIGVFFDGTNNNRERDEPLRGHTNIVRLFNAHPALDAPQSNMQLAGHYRIYVPGLGTRFEPNGEWRESMEGKAMAQGGQARILYALLEVVNAVHKAFSQDIALFQPEAIDELLRDYVHHVQEGEETSVSESPRKRATRKAWVRRIDTMLQKRLARARLDRPRPHHPFIRVNVFGFSRGAAQARAFCYWLDDMLVDGKLGGIPLDIGFLGLFDSVASVGPPHSISRSCGSLGLIDGHFGWAREILGELPSVARRAVHFVAGHEQRMSFPLTRLRGPDVTEVVYPGMHSDVGGGYLPGSQGRAREESQLLSQIPLAHMHREARKWGVPLVDWLWMDARLQRDYGLSPALIAHWNDYMFTAGEDWERREGKAAVGMFASHDFGDLMRQHARLFLNYRLEWSEPYGMQQLLDRLGVQGQDREDIASYNARLKGDVDLLVARRDAIAAGRYHPANRYSYPGDPVDIGRYRKTSNLLPQMLAAYGGGREDCGIDWSLRQYLGRDVRGEGHHALLTHQVHDSLAGFYLVGFSTDEEKAEKLLEIVREARESGPQKLPPYQRQVFENYEKAGAADPQIVKSIDGRLREEARRGRGADTEQAIRRASEAYRNESVFRPEEQGVLGRLFPVQTDEVANSIPTGLENVVRLITKTRREAGGYLLGRVIFDGEPA
ncbi:DUF2235 domain-containing protein [Xylophilus sp. GOD-11R]|uniref:T6SS phospholipase effector Tle1-like catalytic domain-containing protein n=1 Tax=Xylophilus sp. GOD-11R TaxID=3089814 RepID=UPI00298C3E00|nr:DUF2235 domain-containing protein [Xylophilus sp. GOD-11R]WPB55350.1 DUF2235 domain-containing protein [Xylophilus sp. GOD-11R]